MNESTSRLFAMEYERVRLRAPGETPYVTGGYVTGDQKAGHPKLRHEQEPLNTGDIGLRPDGPQVPPMARSGSARVRTCARRSWSGTARATRPAARVRPRHKVAVAKCTGKTGGGAAVFDARLLMAAARVSTSTTGRHHGADAIRFAARTGPAVEVLRRARPGQGRSEHRAGRRRPGAELASPESRTPGRPDPGRRGQGRRDPV